MQDDLERIIQDIPEVNRALKKVICDLGDVGVDAIPYLSKAITEYVKGQIEELEEYCVHDRECLCSQWRKGVPTKEKGFDGYKTLFGYGKNEKWYGKNEYPECTCGLTQTKKNLGVE